MKENRQEKLKISNDLLDAMLVGIKTQDDLWGKEGIITQLNKALLERRVCQVNCEMHPIERVCQMFRTYLQIMRKNERFSELKHRQ